ncbi:hypothetical protein EVAR_9596_1 [Eumeta japonica]|uniref:Uncharacterized protein n=1 Tax=Eumeta variegata TaxID=151549 RepID=A0A4C1TMN9_EUMVA|nr:hypothetical protein EVAR_9596_1 [Eumeta japonica]
MAGAMDGAKIKAFSTERGHLNLLRNSKRIAHLRLTSQTLFPTPKWRSKSTLERNPPNDQPPLARRRNPTPSEGDDLNELDCSIVQLKKHHPPRPIYPSDKYVVTTSSEHSFIRFSKKAKAYSPAPTPAFFTPVLFAPAYSVSTATADKSNKSIKDVSTIWRKLSQPSVAWQWGGSREARQRGRMLGHEKHQT